VELSGKVGEPLVLRINEIEVKSDFILENYSQLSILKSQLIPGNSPYVCENIVVNVSPNAFVNDKMVRQLRQKAVEILNDKRTHRKFLGIKDVGATPRGCPSANINSNDIILDFLDIKELRNEIEQVRKKGLRVGIATWQVHQNGDVKFLESIAELKPDFILVRSLGAFEFLRNRGIELRGDFSLNVCNCAATEYLLENGMASVMPSLDLNKKNGGSAFYTKHCLFSAVFAENKIFPKCGSPCKFHTLEVEDHKGKRYRVFADGGCRNGIFSTFLK
jgi:putative protease